MVIRRYYRRVTESKVAIVQATKAYGGEGIKFLCRTEKLKLMYEVRGRVM